MSNDPNQQFSQASMSPMEAQQAEQARRQINQIAEEIAQLAETDISPAQFYGDFLQRMYFAVQGFAAAIWIRTPQGNLLLQCQINLREVGLDRVPESRPMHDELLRQAALQAKGGIIRPHFSHNFGTGPEQLAGNPTDFIILIIPVMQDKQVIGLLEIWQDPTRPPAMLQNVYQFMLRMAGFVSTFNRNHQLRQMMGQQELWLRLETFTRQIHASLNTLEVAYLVANEGRRLIEADRISVATRDASSKCSVTAISGADVVEKRSNLVQLMRALFDAVIEWGEKLIYTGVKDDALPPDVLHALDNYLGESNSKLLVVMPLQDEREKELKKKPRSALMMECFETNLQPEQLIARLDVIGRHSAPALYNALEYRRIPMRFLWLPLAYVQDGLGGKTKAITTSIVLGVVLLIMAMIFVPFPLKMEAPGEAVPIVRQHVYAPIPGKVDDIPTLLISGSKVAKGQVLVQMSDVELTKQILELQAEVAGLDAEIKGGRARANDPTNKDTGDMFNVRKAEITKAAKINQLNSLIRRTNASLLRPGSFTIAAPKAGIILSSDFRENLVGKAVRPNEPLFRIGYTDVNNPKLSDWELRLKIPQKHYGQVLRAFERVGANVELDVDVLFKAEASSSYSAKLSRKKIACQANLEKDDMNNEPEPVVIAYARIAGDDIPPDRRIPASLLLSGSEITTRIRCGNHAMGYSLFYGIYEFAYEKAIFPYLRWW